MKHALRLAVVFALLVSCRQPAPRLADAFPNHTVLAIEELGDDVRVSFSGPDLESSEILDDQDRADATLFALLAPRPVRPERAVGAFDGARDGSISTQCVKGCAQIHFYRDQSLWVPGEICRQGLLVSSAGFDLGRLADRAVALDSSGVQFPGRFGLIDQVVCYEAYLFYEGTTVCQQACHRCGPGAFECTFDAPGLGRVTVGLPEGPANSTGVVDCDWSDHNDCGIGLPGGG